MENKIKKEALALLRLLHAKEKKYRNLNKKIGELQGYFPTHIQSIDSEYFTKIVNLIDEILELPKLASYLLFEVDGSDRYFYQLKDGKKFPIRNVDDIEKYMEYRDETNKP